MKTELKVLLAAGIGFIGYKAYRIYQAVTSLRWAPTGIKFAWIKDRFTLGGTLFVDIINSTAQTITIDGLSGGVYTADGTMIGDYKLGRTELKPGSNNVRISWGGRSTLTLVSLVNNMVKGIWPVLTFKTIINYKSLPIPTNYTIKTQDLKPSFA
jgi:hypothetical protein